MKKITALFLMALVVLFSAVSAFAAEKADISFDTYSSENGENICVDVLISENGNPSMMQFCIAYDDSILDCVIVSAGDAFVGNNSPIINQIDGRIYFIWDSLTPLGSGGTMIHIEFVPKEATDTSVGIDLNETFIVADANFEEIGNITGSAEIDFAEDDETEDSPTPPSMEPETENGSEESVPDESVADNDTSADIETELETEAEITEEDTVVWESADESVAVIEDGKIVAVAPGTTTITVATEDGEKEASVEITVKEDGTVEVLKNDSLKKGSFNWIVFLPVAVIIAVLPLALKKIKNR